MYNNLILCIFKFYFHRFASSQCLNFKKMINSNFYLFLFKIKTSNIKLLQFNNYIYIINSDIVAFCEFLSFKIV